LLIGVEDSGSVTGVPHTAEEIRQMLDAPTTHIHSDHQLHLQIVTTLEIDDKIVVFFSVPKSTTEIYQLSDGRCLCRRDCSTVPASAKHILFSRQEVASRQYDQQFVDG